MQSWNAKKLSANGDITGDSIPRREGLHAPRMQQLSGSPIQVYGDEQDVCPI